MSKWTLSGDDISKVKNELLNSIFQPKWMRSPLGSKNSGRFEHLLFNDNEDDDEDHVICSKAVCQ